MSASGSLHACPYKAVYTVCLGTAISTANSAPVSISYAAPAQPPQKGTSRLSSVLALAIITGTLPSLTPSQGSEGGDGSAFSFLLKSDTRLNKAHIRTFWGRAGNIFIDVPKESTFIEILLKFNNLANLKSPLC